MGRTIDEIWESLQAEEQCCVYCVWADDCPKRVVGGPNGPIYSPCADGGAGKCFDEKAYFADHPGEEAP